MATQKNISVLLSSLLLLLVISVSLNNCLCDARNFISLNRSLSGSDTIISKNGKFELGFFQPGKNIASPRFYIGIWYKNISLLTPVWVANRNDPVTNPAASELGISEDGNLVLSDQYGNQRWSSDAFSESSQQNIHSFDNPTDTLLPGCKLGEDVSGLGYYELNSWKHAEDPSYGGFTLSFSDDQFSWSSIWWGPWTWKGHLFSQIPNMTSVGHISFEYVSNTTMNYFTYSVDDHSINLRMVIAVSGQIKMLVWMEGKQQWMQIWAPSENCYVQPLCGPFSICNQLRSPYCECLKGFRVASPEDWNSNDYSKGCVRITPLECNVNNSSDGGDHGGFFGIDVIALPGNSTYLYTNIRDCERHCLSNCYCTAFAFSISSVCYLWYGDLLDFQLQESFPESYIGTLHLRLATSKLASSKLSKTKTVHKSILAAVAGSLAFLVAVMVLIWRCRKRNRIRRINVIHGKLEHFQYNDLKQMTKNFSERLGGGAFGSVFRGALADSTTIAVKRLGKLVYHGDKQFRAEVTTIGIIHHVNLVQLYGFCSEGSNKLLVYEYMPRGSLDRNLFQTDSIILGWNMRYQIALGTARGLSYLHEKCRDCIIHCDIKPENILLDDSFNSKVADFGMAKLLSRDFSRVLTTMRGTIGYLAPEWIYGTTITAKADVYSYGMMLLEIISGKRNREKLAEGTDVFFPLLAARKVLEGDFMCLLDQQLEGNVNLEELERACKVACWCVQDDEANRPSMGEVVQILEGTTEVSSPPIPRSFQVLADNPESMVL